MAIKAIKSKDIKRLLIRSTNWVGDAIMTTPAVRAIRKSFPNARISILFLYGWNRCRESGEVAMEQQAKAVPDARLGIL